MSIVQRSNNNSVNRNNGGGIWNPTTARIVAQAANAAVKAVMSRISSSGQAPSYDGGQRSSDTRSGPTRNRKRRGKTSASIPRGIASSRLTVPVTAVFALLNNNGYQVRRVIKLRVPPPSDPDEPNSMFGRAIMGVTDYGVIAAFRNIKVHQITAKFTSNLGLSDSGYLVAGFRKDSFYSQNSLTLDQAASGGASYVGALRDSGQLRYVPTKNKGVMLTDGDDSGLPIEDEIQHVGVMMLYSNNSKGAVGDAVMLVTIHATLECWNEARD